MAKKPPPRKRLSVKQLLANKSQVVLDLGGGENPTPNAINMDIRDLPNVDIVHDIEQYPWPLPDACIDLLTASHVVEHINPARGNFLKWMDEAWRVLKPGGQFLISYPYAGSPGYWQDPTHCLIDGAEVLTQSGFKLIQDVNVGEQILTWNLGTNENEFSDCVRVINEPYEGDILRFKNRRMDIAVTPNHDLIWKTFQPGSVFRKSAAETFESLVPFARRGSASITGWRGTDEDVIQFGMVKADEPFSFKAEDFMQLLGWVLSEGCFVQIGNHKLVNIHQLAGPSDDHRREIIALVERMGFKFNVYERYISVVSTNLFDALAEVGLCADRFIPYRFKQMSPRLLAHLLMTLLAGDGEKHANGGGSTYTTISHRLASDVNEIALKCGLRSKIKMRPGKSFLSPNEKTYTRRDQYRVSITDDRPMLYPKPKRETYRGRIVCVEVAKNHTILTRHNGFVAWVGNCNGCSEATWMYWDPHHESRLFLVYRPRPFHIVSNEYHMNGNGEVRLAKLALKPEFGCLDTQPYQKAK